MARQLTLDLTMPPASSRDDFLVTAANRDALAMLDAPGRWPQGRLCWSAAPAPASRIWRGSGLPNMTPSFARDGR
ncbi:hypothetical protein [Paracoccus thiocyanatus]|uniref:hypothetical protein n=1 Tax=Paracoccus thiocyanatus TaxID=34006 RepID=UPI002869038B|nr:hypothetical protein [Paracoccus thiocyanatus]